MHHRACAFAIGWLLGVRHGARATGRCAFVVLAAIAAAGCVFAPGATDPAAAHQRAQAVLSAWADAVAKAGEHAAVTPVGELTGQIGDWEEAVGDNNKRALMAGMVAADSPLSEEAPPDGRGGMAGRDDDEGAPPFGAGSHRCDRVHHRGALLGLRDAPGNGRTT